MNWRHAHLVVTHGSAAFARKLHHDIAVAKPFPRGAFSCPMDSGVAVRLSIRFGDRESTDVVRLTGCPTVDRSGHHARVVSSALRKDLAMIAPGRWQRYVR